jgi:energy-coupling factor transporter transmembrane protein EcfT
MHPALRILALILFIPLVAHGGLLTGIVGALGVAVLLLGVGASAWRHWLAMNRRLRWFYVSILVLFGWFTPGAELLPALGALSPSREGLLLGLGRVMILAIVVGAVVWLLARSPREEIVAGLLWLTAPFGRVGFPSERFAVRLALTLETVPRLQPIVAEAAKAGPGEGQLQWAGRARGLLDKVVGTAEAAPCEPMELPPASSPPWHHWLVLAACLSPLFALSLWPPFSLTFP